MTRIQDPVRGWLQVRRLASEANRAEITAKHPEVRNEFGASLGVGRRRLT